jgi:hypothetical protein
MPYIELWIFMLKLNLSIKAFILSAVIVGAIIVGAIAFVPPRAEGTTAYLLITTDKEIYSIGENITINLYVVNNGSTTINIISDSYSLEIYNSSGGFINGAGGGVQNDRIDPLIISPYTTRLNSLFPIRWNQLALIDYDPVTGPVLEQVLSGVYEIRATLLDYPLNATKTFEIRHT